MGNLVKNTEEQIISKINTKKDIKFYDPNVNFKIEEQNNIYNPESKIIIPYDATSNIFYMNDNISKIQSVFRGYMKRKEFKSNLFEKKNINHNQTIKEAFTQTSSNQNNLDIDNNNNSNINNEINIEKNKNNSVLQLLNNNITLIKSAKTFFSINQNEPSNSNLLQKPNIIENEIIGNFVLKNSKSLKYKGEKDKTTHQKNGFGIVEWDDKSKLKGNFTNNKINGISKFYNKEKEGTFIGYYNENYPKGYGYYKTLNFKVEGFWEKNLLIGIGIIKYTDESIYEGEFVNNKKNGIGTFKWKDGTIYKGEFKENKLTGNGIILYNDGRIYEGEILNGHMNGYGMFKWKNGDIYIGNYIKDIKSGFGIFIWQKKPLIAFAGFWEKGKQNGIGVKINDNILKYGIWKDGKKDNWINYSDVGKYFSNDKKIYEKKYEKLIGKKILELIHKLDIE